MLSQTKNGATYPLKKRTAFFQILTENLEKLKVTPDRFHRRPGVYSRLFHAKCLEKQGQPIDYFFTTCYADAMAQTMYITCLDLEGVLVPEIWIAFAQATGISELRRTTRDEPDYAKLMNWRLGILKEHHLGLKEIQQTIATIDPLPGAREFLDALRHLCQVIIISDTFTQFAAPLMEKLGLPTIFCNTLELATDGTITGFKMRIPDSKLNTVKALQSIGFQTIASGDSYNDLAMIRASKAGFLFKSTDKIKADNPSIPAYEEYDDLLAAIKSAMD